MNCNYPRFYVRHWTLVYLYTVLILLFYVCKYTEFLTECLNYMSYFAYLIFLLLGLAHISGFIARLPRRTAFQRDNWPEYGAFTLYHEHTVHFLSCSRFKPLAYFSTTNDTWNGHLRVSRILLVDNFNRLYCSHTHTRQNYIACAAEHATSLLICHLIQLLICDIMKLNNCNEIIFVPWPQSYGWSGSCFAHN